MLGGLFRVLRGAGSIAGRERVADERVGGDARAAVLGEGPGEAPVAEPPPTGVEAALDRVPDPVVVGLERVVPVEAGRADEVGRAQAPGGLEERLLVETGRVRGARAGALAARRADQLEHVPRGRRQGGDALPEHLVELEGVRLAPRLRGPAHVPRQLLDEEGRAARLARDGRDGRGLFARQELRRQRLGLLQREGRQGEHAVPYAAHGREDRVAPRRLDRSRGAHDEQARADVGVEELLQEREAVPIGPMQVVDEEHERRALGEAREELAEGAEAAAPELLRVVRLGLERRGGDGLDASEDGEEAWARRVFTGVLPVCGSRPVRAS